MGFPKKTRPIRIEGDLAYIPLTQGYEAVIDAVDVPLAGGTWNAQVRRRKDGSIRTVYAVRKLPRDGDRQPLLRLHRVIMGLPPETEVDHADGDGLNNTRANLRPATDAQNARNARLRVDNRSGFKGVCRVKGRESWQAQITVNGKKCHLGRFGTKEEAFAKYTEASQQLHGDYGRTA
jgi:hypothetical protein